MIEIRQVSKSFGEQHILKQVSLDIAAGTRLCIVGKSGVGKSVLTKLVLGLLELDEGDIFIEGTSIRTFGKKEWQAVLKHFGVVFQGAALFDSLTVLENVGIRLFEEGQLSEDEIEGLVVQALARVHLPADILHKYPAELSGGMRKRVGISRAIIHEPRYLVYDEPTTGLDPVNSSAIDELMLELAERPGRTSIIITHDMFTVKQ
ncbi:MAG: ATP-binding cassette domain-containing protein, partial [Bacteroidetes bacterium]